MKKNIFLVSILIAAIFGVILSCDEKPKTVFKDDIEWQITPVNEGSLTAALQIKFDEPVADLDFSQIRIGGAAVINEKTSIISEDDNTLLIPVDSKYSGEAAVRIIKEGIAAEEKKVNVDGRFSLPRPGRFLNSKGKPQSYRGTVFTDPDYPKTEEDYMPKPYPENEEGQQIPGRVMCAFYDEGGINTAFFDMGENSGSGQLNAGDTYKDMFRMGDPVVDISYLKDSSEEGFSNELQNMLYVGWTESGEWFRITVDVQKAGLYEVELFYSNPNVQPSRITLDFDPEKIIPSLVDPDTMVECRLPGTRKTDDSEISPQSLQHWEKSLIAYIYLEKGQSVMTVRMQNSGLNYCFFDFTLIE